MRRLIPIILMFLLLALAACDGGTNNATGTGDDPGAGGEIAETPMAVDQTAVDGTWTGTMDVGGVQSAVTVTFDSSIGALQGTIDIPDQGIAGQALDSVNLNEDSVNFGVAALDLAFDGVMTGDTLGGDVTQSGAAGTFELTRGG
jgi:hypothetical protein